MGLAKLYRTRPALFFLSFVVFTLTAFPRLNVRIGSAPLYFIDIMIIVSFYYSSKMPKACRVRLPFSRLIYSILFFAAVSELLAFIRYNGAPQPIYQLFETIVPFLLFLSVARVATDADAVIAIFKAAIYGISLSAVLMIMSSLPFSRGAATALFFSWKFLEPAAKGAIERVELQNALALGGVRGRSLIGVSILSGAFINVVLPFTIYYYYRAGLRGLSKKVALMVLLLAPFAVVMSYSRGALLGLFLVVFGLVFWGSSKYKKQILASLFIALVVFSTVGWDSDVFFFDRFERRFSVELDDAQAKAGDDERYNAYSEPFKHVIDHPSFFLFGEGVTVRKMSYGPIPEQAGKATHALFAIAYYSYGLLTAFLYMILWLGGFRYLLRSMKRFKRRKDFAALQYARTLFVSLLGMSSWLLLGHAAISTPRGAMLFFLLFGLISSLRCFRGESRSVRQLMK